MKLTIDTTSNETVDLILDNSKGKMFSGSVPAFRQQGEKLLPFLEKFLAKHDFKLKDIKEIAVVNGQGSFSSLRIGIATANALGYALGVPVTDTDGNYIEKEGLQVVEPKYNAEANIGTKKTVDKA